jgi:predicted signal transduction protein with EAL and GGDEF domain
MVQRVREWCTAMTSDSLIGELPDLVIGVRRDGVILALDAGHGVGALKPAANSLGRNITEIWPETVAALIRQLARKAICTRTSAEARFQDRGGEFEARASAQGPDRAICVIRALANEAPSDPDITAERLSPQIDRRGFLQRFRESASMAALREKPLAVAVIFVDGIADIAQAIAPKVSEQIMTTAILRLSSYCGEQGSSQPSWYLGQLSDSFLALVLEFTDRASIEACVSNVCDSLRAPLELAGDVFHLTPSAGVAILGQDAASARALLDHARAAVNEARRDGGGRVFFFTDSLKLKPLARLDIARELHDAILNRDIRLEYVGRHDLATGRLIAWVGYLRWLHPFRGEIRPTEFLRVAETTGLGTTLSRAAMKWLEDDYTALNGEWGPEVRISFGALRHHLSHEDFVGDFEQLLGDGVIPPDRLELRISERNLAVQQPGDLRPLADHGVQLIVDELGRGGGSLDWLAKAPIRGLQLDRARVVAARKDPVALKFCRAGIAMAQALELTPMAAGIDAAAHRELLAKLGCQQGSGDLYSDSNAPRRDREPNTQPREFDLAALSNLSRQA